MFKKKNKSQASKSMLQQEIVTSGGRQAQSEKEFSEAEELYARAVKENAYGGYRSKIKLV